VTLVSKTWHLIAQRIIDEQVDIVIGSALPYSFEALIDRLHQDKAFQGRVHHLFIREWYGSGYLPYSCKYNPLWAASQSSRALAVMDGFVYEPGQDSSWGQIELLAATLELVKPSRFM
jgi:hypothetical protein